MSKANMTTTLHRLIGLIGLIGMLLPLVGLSTPAQAMYADLFQRPSPIWGFTNNVNL